MIETTSHSLTIMPTKSALGAIVQGIDLNQPLTQHQFSLLQRASNQYHVLIFKEQALSEQALVDFATYFGDVFTPPQEIPVLASQANGQVPIIVAVSNKKGGYTGSGELFPHIDHQWTPRPSKASYLYAVQVPDSGGETTWYNLALAWQSLDSKTKDAIKNLSLITYNPFLRAKGEQRPLYRQADNPPKGQAYPHPLVVTHPESGVKSLYLSSDTEVEIPELSYKEGKALIETLRAHTFRDQFAYQHKWQVGDVIWWDNRTTAHARAAFSEQSIRDMRRISLAGYRPI